MKGSNILHNQTSINIIENDQKTTNEQCCEMLSEYSRDKGKEFTKIKLVQALYAVGLRSVAEKNKLCEIKLKKKSISNISFSPIMYSYEHIALITVMVVVISVIYYSILHFDLVIIT